MLKFNNKLTNDTSQLLEFHKRGLYSSFRDNVWGADLTDMQLISKYNKVVKFLLRIIDLYSKYAWVFLLKNKKRSTVANNFQNNINTYNHKSWLDIIDIEIFNT